MKRKRMKKKNGKKRPRDAAEEVLGQIHDKKWENYYIQEQKFYFEGYSKVPFYLIIWGFISKSIGNEWIVHLSY